jgi:hypothetical protein
VVAGSDAIHAGCVDHLDFAGIDQLRQEPKEVAPDRHLEEIANTVPYVVNENGKFQFQKEEEITIAQDLATEVDGLSRDDARERST